MKTMHCNQVRAISYRCYWKIPSCSESRINSSSSLIRTPSSFWKNLLQRKSTWQRRASVVAAAVGLNLSNRSTIGMKYLNNESIVISVDALSARLASLNKDPSTLAPRHIIIVIHRAHLGVVARSTSPAEQVSLCLQLNCKSTLP